MDNFPVFNQETEAEDLVSDDKMEEEDPNRFKEARDGDHLMTPFQCDGCHFENCKRRHPIRITPKMKLLCYAFDERIWMRYGRGTINGKIESPTRETLGVSE
ncbi:hypothetical protein MHU86_21970 [Fragilaria crotonensis]|nr:hypothetical protein MHU86_21970 [Fragilaria crotonensis]